MLIEKNEMYDSYFYRIKVTIPSAFWSEIERRGDVSRIDSIITELLEKYYI